MKFRIVKKCCWWSSIFDTEQPQFLYYDYDTEHFEVAGYNVARRYKWEFTQEETEVLREDYNVKEEFIVESVKEKE